MASLCIANMCDTFHLGIVYYTMALLNSTVNIYQYINKYFETGFLFLLIFFIFLYQMYVCLSVLYLFHQVFAQLSCDLMMSSPSPILQPFMLLLWSIYSKSQAHCHVCAEICVPLFYALEMRRPSSPKYALR